MEDKKRRPCFFWWAWWTPLQEANVDSVTWLASEIGVKEHPGAFKGAHTSLLRAGRAMYDAGLLRQPVKVHKAKTGDDATFTLSYRASKT